MAAVRALAGPHRQARDGRLQHHRRDRRHAPPRRPGRARRRQLRDGEPQLVRLLGGPDAAPPRRGSRCTAIATASGMFSRHPALGIGFQAYQTLWRLAGVDHMHVHGLQGKFAQADDEVIASARDCLTPLADPAPGRPRDAGLLVRPMGRHRAGDARRPCRSGDLLFMCRRRHPRASGRARRAGVTSIRQAWAAVQRGRAACRRRARTRRSCGRRSRFFGKPR